MNGVFILLHLEDAVHELRELLELRPRLVCLLHRDGDVRPALDRQTSRLAAAQATTAAAEQLGCGFAGDPSAAAELLLCPFGAGATDFLGLFVRLSAEHLHELRPLLRGKSGRRCGSRSGSRGKKDLFALQPVEPRWARLGVSAF